MTRATSRSICSQSRDFGIVTSLVGGTGCLWLCKLGAGDVTANVNEVVEWRSGSNMADRHNSPRRGRTGNMIMPIIADTN